MAFVYKFSYLVILQTLAAFVYFFKNITVWMFVVWFNDLGLGGRIEMLLIF